MRRFVCALLGAWMASVSVPCNGHAEAFEAGFVDLALTDPVEGGPMPAIVVYPTRSAAGTTRLGPITISAGREAPPAPGPHPLIVFSHGTGGSNLGHHDSLTALSRAGFVAAAVQHPRDNYRDDSGFATDLQLVGRAHHIVALIDGLVAHPTVGPLIDRGRIGMVGHSAGGYTALLIAGAVPNFALAKAYREAVPFDPYRQRAEAVGAQRRKPDLQYVADPRVRAVVLLAPAIGYAFDRAALANVHVPVRLYRPAADEMLPHPWHAERIAQSLPVPPEYQVLDRSGHFVFLAPCSWEFAWIAKQICTDPPGVDRAAVHERLNAEMAAFFRRSLTPK
jgi:predicted dienelactone hydrolase